MKNYTSKDIERYHSGQMSAGERHALEKAALDDPFLADALEGYAYTSTPGQDLEKIAARLKEKTSDRKVIPFFLRTNNWLKYAAMILIVAGGAFLTYKITAKKDQSRASENINRDTATHQLQVLEQKNSGSTPTDSGQTTPTLTVTSPGATQNNKLNQNLSAIKKGTQVETYTNSATNPQEHRETVSSSLEKQNADYYKKKVDSSKDDQAIVTSSNAANTLFDKSKDLSKSNGDTLHLHDIVMQPLPNQQLNEVVVSGYGTQRKTAPMLKEQIIVDTLEPAEGWSYFNDYIANNIQIPDELKDKLNSGDVKLAFDVDKDGVPTNITVLKSLCAKCDEEAIRLLKDGPKWKKKKNKKGKVTIHF